MITVAVGIVYDPSDPERVLLCQRNRTARYPLKWEFPGGKLEERESPEDSLRRELKEELGIEVIDAKLFHQQRVTYPDGRSFEVFYFIIPSFRGALSNNVFEAVEWVNIRNISSYDLLEGNREAVQKFIRYHETNRAVKS